MLVCIRVLAVLLLAPLMLVGCAKEADESPEQPMTPTKAGTSAVEPPPTPASGGLIGLSVLTTTNPFFNEISDAAKAAAAQHGFEVKTTSSEFDPAKQLDQVKDFIVQGAAAIILTPADSKAVGTAIQEANDAGIPVFTADIACTAEGVDVVCHIATDNYQGGREAAKALMEALGNRGKVAIIDHPVVESVQQRTQGFHDELAESGSEIEVIGAWPGLGTKDGSFTAAQDILTANPDLDGFFAINDPSALGACAALEKAEREGEVVVVGFDGQPEGKEAIRDGRIYADPIQFPREIGEKTIDTIVRYLDGEDVEPEILIPTKLYKQSDAVDDPELQ